jgi:DNA-binding beta-propeller fold protein YncE
MRHTYEKGTTVTDPELSSKKTPRTATDFFGRLVRQHNVGGVFSPEIRTRIGLAIVSVLVATVGMSIATSPALAKRVHLFAGSFGAATSTPANPYPLAAGETGPTSVAVDDSTGDVYVTDRGNSRIEKFSASGEFILMFGKEVNETKVKVDAPEAEQNICTAASGDVCKTGSPGTSPGALDKGDLFVAVDNSSGGSRGDVYVADTGDQLVSKFDSSGEVVGTWGDNGPLETPNGQLHHTASEFALPFEGIAVDTAGNLWVGLESANEILEFTQAGNFVLSWRGGRYTEGKGIAVDSEDNVYVTVIAEAVKFNSRGAQLGNIPGDEGLAADSSSNELYVASENSDGNDFISRRGVCEPALPNGCEALELFGAGHLGNNRTEAESEAVVGLAVNPSTSGKIVYATVAKRGEVAIFPGAIAPDISAIKASNLTPTTATLNGAVNPAGVELNEGTAGCRFEWGKATGEYEHVVACQQSAAQIGSGSQPVDVNAAISGLEAGKIYHFRLVAGNANDVNTLIDEPTLGVDLAFGPPLIESESSLGATGSSVTLQGQVNPNNVDTNVRIEYGTTAGVYGQVATEADLGSSATGEIVSVHLQGLDPDATYHYRLVAKSSVGSVEGEDRSFMTQDAGGALVLPDGRAWELVSPENANSALLAPIAETGLLQAATSGDAFSYLASYPVGTDAQGYGGEVQVLSSRGPGGWSSEDVSLSHSVAAGAYGGYGDEYRFFSEDMSMAVTEGIGGFSKPESEGMSEASPQPTERTPYVRHDLTCVQMPATCYEPVLTEAPGEDDVTSLKPFGGSGETALGEAFFVGATPDISDMVISSSVQLTEKPLALHGGLYEWSVAAPVTERLQPVSVLPESEGGALAAGAELGRPQMRRHAISDDGSRVFFSLQLGTEEHLYMRDTLTDETVRLDLPEAGSGGTASVALFEDASANGSDVFFIDRDRLTKDSAAGANLYECEIVEVEEANRKHLKCDLSDLTPVPSAGQPGAGEAAGVLGNVVGSSEEDGGYVYFAANGVQAEGATPGDCKEEISLSAGKHCSLYVRHDGVTSFIAMLSSDDSPDWGLAAMPTSLGELTARVSPDGVWLAFMSDRPLIGYDNRDARSGMPDEEVYLYNAQTGKLVCASCNPTGSRPAGMQYVRLETSEAGLVGGDRVWSEKQWLAANVPGWTPYRLSESLHQSRYLSDSGRLFFNSSDALVSQDINGNEDVYEYEPEGAGSGSARCGPMASGVYKPSRTVEVEGREVQEGTGCVGLISSGLAFGQSAFLDASANGSDVFFLTAEKLVPQDVGTGVSVYDAHECTSSSPCAPTPPVVPAECTSAAACRAAPMSQPAIFGAPSSATFSGVGNVTVEPLVSPAGRTIAKKTIRCRKGRHLSHGKCVKVKRKRVKQDRKASHDRGAKR